MSLSRPYVYECNILGSLRETSVRELDWSGVDFGAATRGSQRVNDQKIDL
jgi:hypothetical protein